MTLSAERKSAESEAIGYRTERSLVGCFVASLLRFRPSVLEQVLGRKVFLLH